MFPTLRLDGFRGEYLWEFELAERQILAMADALPPEKYGWYPAAGARSSSEVFVHLAGGHFMLLQFLGVPAPVDIYGPAGAQPCERLLQITRRNDELGKDTQDKPAVTELLRRSLNAVRDAINATDDAALAEGRFFFGEQTTVRRIYIRLLVHLHEHMGQMIAYVRMNDMKAPWPDWRPDRR
jgi:uncharacterized damage-inducible protein DinB